MKDLNYYDFQQMDTLLGKFSEITNAITSNTQNLGKKTSFLALFLLIIQVIEPIREMNWSLGDKLEIFTIISCLLSSLFATYFFFSIERLKRVNADLAHYKIEVKKLRSNTIRKSEKLDTAHIHLELINSIELELIEYTKSIRSNNFIDKETKKEVEQILIIFKKINKVKEPSLQ